jgi:hypothetical protein
MLAWPALLPQPQIAGNARRPADLAVRSSISGPALARRRSTMIRDACPVSWVMTDDQLAIFDAWWHHTLGHGCAWFLVTLHGETGNATHTARLSGGYSAASQGGSHWRISAALELDDPPRGSP